MIPPEFPDPSWSKTEQFIWTCATSGEVADLTSKYAANCAVKSAEGWPEERTVSATFLETILTEEEWKKAVHPRGLRITGARFMEPLNLSNLTIPFPLWLDATRFEQEIDASGLTAEGIVSFVNTFFAAPLNLQQGECKKSLIMRGATFQEINLRGARIGGQLEMSEVTVSGKLKLNMNGIQVEGDLFMRDNATFQEIDLRGSRIGGQLSMSKATVSGKLNMNGMQVERDLFMGDEATFQEVDLGSAWIGGQLDMKKATVTGELNMDSMQVEGSCLAHSLTLLGALVAHGASFKGDLDFSGATFHPEGEGEKSSVDLSGVTVGEEFRLWQPGAAPIKWGETALILRNLSCQALQDHPEGWPKVLDLTGFTYNRFGGLGGGPKGAIAHRSTDWILRWLRRQADGETLRSYRLNRDLPANVEEGDRFSPQSYEWCATILEKEGMHEKARAVHIDKMNRFREGAKGREWFWLTSIKCLINYGYSLIFPLYWALAFLGIGWGVGYYYAAHHCFPYDPLSFSLDMLLPVVQLHPPHYDFVFDGWLYRWWFQVEQIAGYVLALFLAAGLAGLTKR